MAILHKDTKKLYTAIECSDELEKPKALARLRTIIDNAPEVLASFGIREGDGRTDVHSPLACAVERDNHEAAEIIIDALKNSEYAKKIIAQLTAEERLSDITTGNVLYMRVDSKRPIFTHAGRHPGECVKSPRMLEMLWKKGYDFHVENRPNRSSFFNEMVKPLITAIMTPYAGEWVYENADKKALEILEKAVELGFDTHRYDAGQLGLTFCNRLTKTCNRTMRPAGREIAGLTDEERNISKDRIVEYLAKFAAMGFDCRDFLDPDAFKAEDFDEPHRKDIFTYVQDHFREIANNTPDHYLKCKNAGERLKLAHTTAATGTFPILLAQCARNDAAAGNTEQTTELLGYLDNEWKGQYQTSIRTAQAALARTAPPAAEIRASRLASYVSGGTPENSGRT